VTDASDSPILPGPPLYAVGPNHVRLLRDGREAFPAALAAIGAAKHEILVEIYWFSEDRTGLMFRDALVERARAGVKVRVVFDSVGSFGVSQSMWQPLLAAGATVHEFAPVSVLLRRFRLGRVAFRDHRKIIVVDGKIGFTGGVNLGDEWSPGDEGGGDWRDDAIEVRGPAAGELRALFFETWRRCRLEVPPDAGPMEPDPAHGVAILANRVAHGRKRRINQTYLLSIHRAERRIDIANAYFLPGRLLLAALRKACRRGAQVRILIPEHGDVLVASLAMQWLVGRLIRYGCRVFVLTGRMMHAKTAVFDETMAMIGSSNLDARSRKYNLECNIAVFDAAFAAAVRLSFERDLNQATELSLAGWKQQSPLRRLIGRLSYMLRRFL
jgi:cardiolipin synthase A/B